MALDGEEINIFVAIGNLNGRNEANYHFGQRTGSEGIHQLFVLRNVSWV